MKNKLNAILTNVLLKIGLPEDQMNVVIPAINHATTQIDEADLPEFFEKLAQNPKARLAFSVYFKKMLSNPSHKPDDFELFFNQYILPNLKDEKQKLNSSRRK